MNHITAQYIAWAFGAAFLATGALGFIPNPLVAPDGIFEVNLMHNLVHIFTGVGFLAGALLSETGARVALQVIGVAYAGVAVLGFLTEGHLLLGLVHINEADRWLHAGLAVVILAAAFGLPRVQARLALDAG